MRMDEPLLSGACRRALLHIWLQHIPYIPAFMIIIHIQTYRIVTGYHTNCLQEGNEKRSFPSFMSTLHDIEFLVLIRSQHNMESHSGQKYLSITMHLDPITKHLNPITKHLNPITKHLNPITKHLDPITKYLDPINSHQCCDHLCYQ